MKKNILAVAFLAGMSASVAVNAADPIAQKTGFQGQGEVSTTACKLLASQVTLSLSSNVWGAYSCDEATSVIKVAACHSGGSRKPKEVDCTVDPADDTKFVPAGCTAATGKVTISDYSGYVAGSNGGSVGQDVLGGACDGTSVKKLTP